MLASTQALRVLADLVRRCPQGQDQLGALRVALPPADPLLTLPLSSHQAQQEGLPALQAVLRLALHSPWPAEQAAAEQLLAAFCCDNPDGQSLLLSTMAP
ncbi:Golgin candidate 6-like, partial [Haematococcus lacustris]